MKVLKDAIWKPHSKPHHCCLISHGGARFASSVPRTLFCADPRIEILRASNAVKEARDLQASIPIIPELPVTSSSAKLSLLSQLQVRTIIYRQGQSMAFAFASTVDSVSVDSSACGPCVWQAELKSDHVSMPMPSTALFLLLFAHCYTCAVA